MDDRISILVRLPRDLKQQVEEIAQSNRRSTVKEVQVALEAHVKAQQAQASASA